MIILGIETSCDETAVSVVEASGRPNNTDSDPIFFKVLGQALYSQVKIHAEYGGVFPALAKREHAKNLSPLLEKVLEEAPVEKIKKNANFDQEKIKKILERETGLADDLLALVSRIDPPAIDAIAVTAGPGLEPALWVGINFALALGEVWHIPVYPTNHMAGHLFSPLISGGSFQFPVIALLISGGHTELVLAKNWHEHQVIGQTRDDAVGEAFDKVARLLGLPYPGGPAISLLAQEARNANVTAEFSLPRPMLNSGDFAFSFSGLKTAVLYLLKKFDDVNDDVRHQVAREFEDAVTDVLITKTQAALRAYNPKTLVIAGGVSANTHLRAAFTNLAKKYPDLTLLIPPAALSTDNAVMITAAAYIDLLAGRKPATIIHAQGNMTL